MNQTRFRRSLPVLLLAGVAACSDAAPTAPASSAALPAVRPAASTTEEHIDWQGNEFSFVDDHGVHHRFVASYDGAGRLTGVDFYRNWWYEGGMDNAWSSQAVSSRDTRPAYTGAWALHDLNYQLIKAGDQYGTTGGMGAGEPCVEGDVCADMKSFCDAQLSNFARSTTGFLTAMGAIVFDLSSRRGRVSRGTALVAASAWAVWMYDFWKYDECLRTDGGRVA